MLAKTVVALVRKAAKRRRKLASSDVAIVSAAKSGRTWLSAMISHVYHQRFGLPESDIIRGDNFHRMDRRAPRILFTHDNRKDSKHHPLFHAKDFRGLKTVLLVRDPRDVAVSAHFQSLRNANKRDVGEVAARAEDSAMFGYVALRKMPQVIAFLKRWEAQWPKIEAGIVVRYEDLRWRPESELKRIMEFIDGQEASPQEIERAVAFASFDSLKSKEADHFFSTDRLRPGIASNPDSFKVRRGKVGGYQDYFSSDQLTAIEAMVAEAKLDAFGYVPNPNLKEAKAAGSTTPSRS